MRDHVGSRATLDRVEVSAARKSSLGIMIAGDCNWKAEEARLLRASALWKAQVQAGHLSSSDAWYALNHTIMKTVEHPMMATYLSKAQCEKIMRPFLNAGLSASGGVVRSMPRAIVWGPTRYQGLGIHFTKHHRPPSHHQAIRSSYLDDAPKTTSKACKTPRPRQTHLEPSTSPIRIVVRVC
jgi:hypothetical protein